MADSDLARTHPATIVVRSFKALSQAVVGFFALALFGLANRGTAAAWLGIGALVVLSTGITTGFSWLNWVFFRYGIVGDDLVIAEGWLVKKRRSIPLARVQGVDIRADVVSRIMGLTDVMIQTAGGGEGESEARIGSIRLRDAEHLRARLISGHTQGAALAGATGLTALTPASAVIGADPLGRMSDFRGALGGESAEEPGPIFEHHVPFVLLVAAGITSNAPLAALAISVGVAGQAIEFIGAERLDDAGSALSALALPALVALGIGSFVVAAAAAVAVTVSRDFGFTVRRTRDRLETEAGLLERRMTSVPVRRIQAVLIESTPLRRLFRLGAVRIHTAGFGRGEEQQSTTASALVPIAPASQLRVLLHHLLPEAENFPQTTPVPRRALRFYLLVPTSVAVAVALAVVGAPLALAMQLADSAGLSLAASGAAAFSAIVVGSLVAAARALSWRSSAFGVDDRAIAITYGVLGTYRARIPRTRIQSLTVRQSPFQKHADLATLVVASVSGSARKEFRVLHLELADAARIQQWFSASAPASPASAPGATA